MVPATFKLLYPEDEDIYREYMSRSPYDLNYDDLLIIDGYETGNPVFTPVEQLKYLKKFKAGIYDKEDYYENHNDVCYEDQFWILDDKLDVLDELKKNNIIN
jgi:hypothetical protein